MRKMATISFSFAVAILFSRYFVPYHRLLIYSAAAVAISLFGLLFIGRTRLLFFLILIPIAAGLMWSRVFISVFVKPAGQYHEKTTQVVAVVTGYPSARTRGYRVKCKIRSGSGRSISTWLYYYRETDLQPGDMIEVTARFSRTDGMEDSERIDTFNSQGAFLIGYVSGNIKILGAQRSLLHFPLKLANSTANMIDKLFDRDVSPFMQALIAGNREKLNSDKVLITALSASGISHVVSISGMHVSYLMGFLSVFIKKQRLFAIIGIPLLVLFMAMTGFTASVTRAGIMQIFLISAPIFRRESDSLTSLSTALLVLLALNPFSVASVGLQLSFASTLGIILFTGKINTSISDTLNERRRAENKALRMILSFIASSFSTTVGALVFTLPLSVIHFGTISLIAPVTNLLTLWALSLAFPLGILACILGLISVPVGIIAAFPVTYAVRYIVFVARALAAIPFSAVYSSNPYILIWLAYIYVVFVTLPLYRVAIKQYLLPSCLAIITICAILFVSPFLFSDYKNSITVLDVGQGLSVVFYSDDKIAVVDCGSTSGENAGFITHEYLSNQGKFVIDLLILTHFHDDHINGVEYLLSRMNVAAIAIPDPEGFFQAEDIIQLARKCGTDIIYVTETLRVSLGDTDLIIYPPPLYGESSNERGLCVLSVGSINALITGDMSASAERSLLRFAALPDIDILVVGHHGSRFSTSEELLSAVKPEIAVIPVGRNSYGHPSEEVLLRLDYYFINILRTDHSGHITIRGR